MTTGQDGAQEVFAVATRITTLDVNGFPAVGANTFTTNSLLKCSFAPAEETGVDLTTINAAGDLFSHYKHGDMPKYYTVQLEMGTPDPILHQMLAGGTVLTANNSALGTPTGTVTAVQNTGANLAGTLAAGTYGYRVTQFNQYGETTPTTEVTATTTGSTGAVVVSGAVAAAGATGLNVYGRTPGGEQLLGSMPILGTVSASCATGTVTSIPITTSGGAPLPIPAGTTFTITGDTNSPKIVFTVTTTAGTGATAIAVSTSTATVTTAITAAQLVPCFVDNGTITPSGGFPTTDSTAGPGNDVGYAAAPLGVVGNPNGVSLELWGSAIINGAQTPNLPFFRWAIPKIQNITEGGRTFQPAILENVYMGQAVENPNWGSGPFGDWPFPSTKVYQYMRTGRSTLPTNGLAPVAATY